MEAIPRTLGEKFKVPKGLYRSEEEAEELMQARMAAEAEAQQAQPAMGAQMPPQGAMA